MAQVSIWSVSMLALTLAHHTNKTVSLVTQVAKLHGEEEGEQEELQLYDIQDDGRGRLDWTAAERAFDARLLKIKGRGPPGVFPSGDREGLTRDTFQPGSVLPVTVYRKQGETRSTRQSHV